MPPAPATFGGAFVVHRPVWRRFARRGGRLPSWRRCPPEGYGAVAPILARRRATQQQQETGPGEARRRVLVTGGTSGIGAAIARVFAAADAEVRPLAQPEAEAT